MITTEKEVKEVYPDSDDCIRSIKTRSQNTDYIRAVSKVVQFEINQDIPAADEPVPGTQVTPTTVSNNCANII